MSNMDIRQKGEKNQQIIWILQFPFLPLSPLPPPDSLQFVAISFRSWLKHHFSKILSTQIKFQMCPQTVPFPQPCFIFCYTCPPSAHLRICLLIFVCLLPLAHKLPKDRGVFIYLAQLLYPQHLDEKPEQTVYAWLTICLMSEWVSEWTTRSFPPERPHGEVRMGLVSDLTQGPLTCLTMEFCVFQVPHEFHTSLAP